MRNGTSDELGTEEFTCLLNTFVLLKVGLPTGHRERPSEEDDGGELSFSYCHDEG